MNIHTVKRLDNNSEKVILLRNQLVKLADLHDFRVQLLDDMKKLLSHSTTIPNKKWLKSCEVRKLLNISSGTLQTLRTNGTLPYNKVGGMIFYQYEDIAAMMENGSDNRSRLEKTRMFQARSDI